MPKASNPAPIPALGNLMKNFTQQQLENLSRLAPAQRNIVLASMMKEQQRGMLAKQQAQAVLRQQAHQDSGNALPFNHAPGHDNHQDVNGINASLAGNQTGRNTNVATMGLMQQNMMNAGLNRGGMPGGVPFEMMQSFMQRNGEVSGMGPS